jgi:hypothetical protein
MSSTNATSAAAIAAKDDFIIDIKEQLALNFANETTKTFEGMKMRLKTANTIAKIINKRFTSVLDTMLATNSSSSNGRFLSIIYLKMHEMMNDCLNCHRRHYLNGEKEILKVKDYALRLNKNARKCMNIVYNLMSKINDKSDIPSYDEIVSKHNAFKSGYSLRPRKPVNYIEDEDANFDDASDEDYIDEDEVVEFNNDVGRPKRNIPRVDYTGMDEENDDMFDDDYVNDNVEDDDEDDELDFCVDDDDEDEYIVDNVDDAADEQFVSDYFNDPDYINAEDINDDDSEYSPSDDEEFDDDHVLEFDDDDYAEESEEDDDDYEDEDELRKEDLEFLMDYHNDRDYKEENNVNDDDNDSEYIPDAEDELEDDHVLNFDDDDYAEESEEDDDNYEDSETDDIEDRQFVSDYFNDPDYNPDENVEEEDELEYDFSFKQNANVVKSKKTNNLVLKAGIEEDEDYNPEDDCEDDEDDEEVMYACNKDNLIIVCKRIYDRNSGKVRYNWVHMTKADFENKYDGEYVEENV